MHIKVHLPAWLRKRPGLANTLLAFGVLISACGGSSSSSPPIFTGTQTTPESAFEYRATTADDLNDVRDTWANRDLTAQNVEIVFEDVLDEYTVHIIQHSVQSKTHYGAIITPVTSTPSDLPVVIFPDGLNQQYPAVDVESFIEWHQSEGATFENFVKLVPAFRGRSLNYAGLSLPADGDFCDAYDGAADDAIALINAAESITDNARFDKIISWGGSRGAIRGCC